jgi:hypothetical protein
MRMPAAAMAGMILAGCAASPAPASDEKTVEAFMWEYTRVWNTHDAAKIARDFYRTGPAVPEQTASLETSFATLRAQGYKSSDIRAIKACMTGADAAWAGMRFSRLKADGEPLPPKDRASAYDLKKFADGWRIVKVMSADAAEPLECPDQTK